MSARSWNSGTKKLEEIAEAVILNEEYDPNDKAYKKRTPADQAKYDAMQRRFKDNSARHHEKDKEKQGVLEEKLQTLQDYLSRMIGYPLQLLIKIHI